MGRPEFINSFVRVNDEELTFACGHVIGMTLLPLDRDELRRIANSIGESIKGDWKIFKPTLDRYFTNYERTHSAMTPERIRAYKVATSKLFGSRRAKKAEFTRRRRNAPSRPLIDFTEQRRVEE